MDVATAGTEFATAPILSWEPCDSLRARWTITPWQGSAIRNLVSSCVKQPLLSGPVCVRAVEEASSLTG